VHLLVVTWGVARYVLCLFIFAAYAIFLACSERSHMLIPYDQKDGQDCEVVCEPGWQPCFEEYED
jgi:hypothetical protein